MYLNKAFIKCLVFSGPASSEEGRWNTIMCRLPEDKHKNKETLAKDTAAPYFPILDVKSEYWQVGFYQEGKAFSNPKGPI